MSPHLSTPIDEILELARGEDRDAAAVAVRERITTMLVEERRRAARTSVVAMSEEDAVRYRAISGLASDFVYAVRIDEEYKVPIEWTQGAFDELTGYSVNEVNEMGGWMALMHPEDREAFSRGHGPLAIREPTTLEYRVTTRAGHTKWLRDHACPELDAAGERIVRIYGAVKDVTQEKEAQGALREAMKRLEQRVGFEEARFRSVLDQAGEAIYMIDPADGTFIDVNQTACRMLGYSRRELLEMSVDDIEVEKPAWTAPDQFEQLRRGSVSMESYHRHRDGSTFPVEIAVSVRRYAGRDYLLAISRETTERKEMEVQLVQADRLASVGVLAAGVAHEVNNPLVYILSNVSWVLSELPLEYTELRDALREARSGAERVRDIVQDLKTFARSEERIGPVDVRHVLDTSLKLASNEIRFRATLEREYEQDVPPVRASDRLGQVFLNLLMNAVHAMPEGGPTSNRIVVAVRHQAGRVAVSIEDTGCGIAPEKLTNIFDPFFTTKPVGMGTGLGLSICRNITKSLGGDIEVESDLGHGSKFTVWLPAIVDDAQATIRPSSIPPAETVRCLRILVVDDDPFVARAVSRLLRAQHSVTLAGSGMEALALVTNQPFDVVFCDVMMPSMTGMELYQEVSERVPELADRFVFITGGAFTPEARQFLAESDILCLQKPFSPKDLATALEAVAEPRDVRTSDGLRSVGGL